MFDVRTERLELTTASSADAPDLLAYHERNREHLRAWEPTPPPGFYTTDHWERVIADDARSGTLRAIARVIGERPIVASVNLHAIMRGVAQRGTIGYSVDGTLQGKGYGREAVCAVVHFGFANLSLHRIEAAYQPVNERSGRLLRSLGFVVEGYARDYLYIADAWRDHVLTSKTNPAEV